MDFYSPQAHAETLKQYHMEIQIRLDAVATYQQEHLNVTYEDETQINKESKNNNDWMMQHLCDT